MPSKEQTLRANRAASAYLEMRGYEIMEQNWSLGKNKVSIIAKKAGQVYFMEVEKIVNGNDFDPTNLINHSKIKQARGAAERWMYENKWTEPVGFASIYLDENYLVMSFNEGLDY